jgi:transcriptional regulator with XRE-family HTH domain
METYFSKNAEVLLKQKHLTKKEFCEKLGKQKSNWQNIVKTNNLEMLSQIARILEMPIEDVIGLNKDKLSVSGYIKVCDKSYLIESPADIKAVMDKITEWELGEPVDL